MSNESDYKARYDQLKASLATNEQTYQQAMDVAYATFGRLFISQANYPGFAAAIAAADVARHAGEAAARRTERIAAGLTS